ncbi:MAG: aconitate hydratase AcnA, partial [Alphaproteobacteria bacterium]|nr:aconitate hydratase AcnA [Alphaproteobacteria bacterium]
LVAAYSKAQGLYRDAESAEPVFTDTLELDLGDVVPSIAGPKRPQDRIALDAAAPGFAQALKTLGNPADPGGHGVKGRDFTLSNGHVVIAAITSCTNTSNPSVLIAAGLVARKARELGLKVKPWVKTSLAPGSQVVTDYLTRSGLQEDLDGLGFNLVGYGCTTCIGNSGPLAPEISKTIHENNLVATSVLSGNRNFEGRVNPDVKANYLASPPLVVAYALAGSMTHDIVNEPLGTGKNGQPVYLRDIWPSSAEVTKIVRDTVTAEMFSTRYSDVFKGDAAWQEIPVTGGETYGWRDGSTYIQNPPYFEGITQKPKPVADIARARILGLFENSITTDHISPAGSFKLDSPAGQYLRKRQVAPKDFNSYGARRGNHEVMMRGTFANIRIKNQMVPGVEGGFTLGPDGNQATMFEAAMAYGSTDTPLVVLAGKEYGTGSSRDWAAKGARLLGVRAVIAESFERIHRSNLIGMGVLPLQFADAEGWQSLGLTGDEQISIGGLADLTPRAQVTVVLEGADGSRLEISTLCRIDTVDELEYYRHGGILHYVLRMLSA